MIVTIKSCARCQENHVDIEFKEFTNRPEGWSHWSPCPTNGEPILLIVDEE